MLITALGLVAAAMTSLSYIPQVRKTVPRGSTDDLSFKTLIVLAAGLGLWILYGVFKGDWVIIAANGVGCALVAVLLDSKSVTPTKLFRCLSRGPRFVLLKDASRFSRYCCYQLRSISPLITSKNDIVL
jgi:MtN3 and saliva related transmembrane protein